MPQRSPITPWLVPPDRDLLEVCAKPLSLKVLIPRTTSQIRDAHESVNLSFSTIVYISLTVFGSSPFKPSPHRNPSNNLQSSHQVDYSTNTNCVGHSLSQHESLGHFSCWLYQVQSVWHHNNLYDVINNNTNGCHRITSLLVWQTPDAGENADWS